MPHRAALPSPPSGYFLFGSLTSDDILKNLSIDAVSTLVHPALALGLVSTIVAAYSITLCTNSVLKVWAVRENLCDMLGCNILQLSGSAFYCATLLEVAAAYIISQLVPSIWVFLSLIGSTVRVP